MALENAYQPLTVLYYDFELVINNFKSDYSNERGSLLFSDIFFIDNLVLQR
jgi:hypothetical protein